MAPPKVSSLLITGKTVLFTARGSHLYENESVFDGSVIFADDERQVALICYLCGMRSYTDDVPYADVHAIPDPDGEYLEIKPFVGRFIDLRAAA